MGMSIIKKSLDVEGNVGSVPIEVIFDSAASVSLIRRELAEKISTITSGVGKIRLTLGDGEGAVESDEVIYFRILVHEIPAPDMAYVVDKLAVPFIIGAKTLQSWRAILDFEKDDVVVDPGLADMMLL